jgi:PepSY-associated TM region
MHMSTIQQISANTRWHRKFHRLVASVLMVFFFFVSITGFMLGWKKNSKGLLLAESKQGSSTQLGHWLSMDSLNKIAIKVLHDSIDIRPSKGMVKFTFKAHFNAIQLDASTGRVLMLEKRRADWIEKLHDGSILDHYAGFSGQPIKLLYTSMLGGGLFFLTLSGFWLWYNPKRIRKQKSQN